MHKLPRFLANRLLVAGACACLGATSLAQISVRSVKVLGSKDSVEIEVESSDRIVPETRVLTGPDRLVIDFPNAVPGSQIRNQSVDRGEVKDVRVGLWQSKPPITRLVLDLKSARSYQVFPYGRTVMIKVLGDVSSAPVDDEAQAGQRPGLIAANYVTSAEPVSVAARPLQVSYQNGMLGVNANKATLSEVLYAIQQRTGAEISIPAGAEQERVVTDIGPAPAAEVLARLLNGSRFNFLILNSATDPRQLDRVILSVRGEGAAFVPAPLPAQNDDTAAEDQLVAQPNPPAQPAHTAPLPPPEQPQPPEENSQDQ